MHNAIKTIIVVLLGSIVFAAVGAGPVAAYTGSSGVKACKQRERSAYRQLVRAKARYSKARAITRATRAYAKKYGKNTGRWVRLAASVGWPRATWGRLCCVIHRESRGSPKAKNPYSTASGLLQLLAFHWNGSGDYHWKFNPFDPRQNLRYGYLLYRKCGWSPWLVR